MYDISPQNLSGDGLRSLFTAICATKLIVKTLLHLHCLVKEYSVFLKNIQFLPPPPPGCHRGLAFKYGDGALALRWGAALVSHAHVESGRCGCAPMGIWRAGRLLTGAAVHILHLNCARLHDMHSGLDQALSSAQARGAASGPVCAPSCSAMQIAAHPIIIFTFFATACSTVCTSHCSVLVSCAPDVFVQYLIILCVTAMTIGQ